jgi:hypothetical protein
MFMDTMLPLSDTIRTIPMQVLVSDSNAFSYQAMFYLVWGVANNLTVGTASEELVLPNGMRVPVVNTLVQKRTHTHSYTRTHTHTYTHTHIYTHACTHTHTHTHTHLSTYELYMSHIHT